MHQLATQPTKKRLILTRQRRRGVEASDNCRPGARLSQTRRHFFTTYNLECMYTWAAWLSCTSIPITCMVPNMKLCPATCNATRLHPKPVHKHAPMRYSSNRRQCENYSTSVFCPFAACSFGWVKHCSQSSHVRDQLQPPLWRHAGQ